MLHSYSHLMISTRPDYVPPASALMAFMGLVEALGVVHPWELWLLDRDGSSILSTPSGRRRIPGLKISLDDVVGIESAAEAASNFDLRASGEGVPRRLLMPLVGIQSDLFMLTETLHIAVACHVRATTVGMSDVHDDATGPRPRQAPGFFLPCPATDQPGYFTHPENRSLVEVAHAGTARFWISLHVGNGIRPVLPEGNFNAVLEPMVKEFEGILGTPLGQAGTWG